MENEIIPGKGKATGSLVCGIISVVCIFFGWGALLSLILGIVGLVLASGAKKDGFVGSMRTAGFVLSLIGLIFGGIVFVSCTLCTILIGGAAAAAASSDEWQALLNEVSFLFF